MKEVSLKRWEISFQEDLKNLADNIEIFNNVRDHFPHPYSMDDASRFIRSCMKEDPPLNFAILIDGDLAGAIGLKKQDDVYRHSAEVGYWIGQPFWNMGIASTAVQLITNYAFEELALERLFAKVYAYNEASKKVLEKAGYKLEGVLEKGAMKNGKLVDEWRFARLRD